MKRIQMTILSSLIISLTSGAVFAADAPKMKMTTNIPQEITIPGSVDTRLGTLVRSNS